MEEAAFLAVCAWIAYMKADGVFPEPEYDQFHLAMERLAKSMGLEEKLLVARNEI